MQINRRCSRLVAMIAILVVVLSSSFALTNMMEGPEAFQLRKAYAQSIPTKVKKAYVNKAKSLARQVRSRMANYKFVDVYGSSLKEMLCVTKDSGGSGSTLYIYTYAGGKVKQLLQTGIYGDQWYKFYKKTSSFVIHRCGHGGDGYESYRVRNGKYVTTMVKGRHMDSSGSYGSWSYYNAIKGKSTTKGAYAKYAKKYQAGTAKKVTSSYKWPTLYV